MTNEQQMLLSILSKALFSRELERGLTVDWNTVFEEAKAQAVPLITFEALDKSLVPEDVLNKWKSYSGGALVKNLITTRNHVKVDCWMREAGIPYVIIKGSASSHYYPDPIHRLMGDVDFLVPMEHIERAKELFRKNVSEPCDDGHPFHLAYEDNTGTYELHYSVAGIPTGGIGEKVRQYLSDIFDRARTVPVEYGSIVIPSHFHHGLILLIHSCCHLTKEGIGLRQFSDFAVFAASFSNDDFISIFKEKLSAVGLWTLAQVFYRAAVKFLGAEDREWSHISDDSIPEALMEDILAGGNFGRRDEQRSFQGLVVTDYTAQYDVEARGMLAQFIHSKNKRVMEWWPLTRRVKLLIPFGWIGLGCQSLFLIIMGKRRAIDIKRMVSGAQLRRELYRMLELYKTDEDR